MGGPIHHLREPRGSDCDPEHDDFDGGFLCRACRRWALANAVRLAALREAVAELRRFIDERLHNSPVTPEQSGEATARRRLLSLFDEQVAPHMQGGP